MLILLISPLYYPAQSPNVYRWDAIARHWTAQGHELHWLCTRFHDEPSEANVNGIFVHRVGHYTLLDWGYDLVGLRKNRRGLPGSGLPQRSRLRQILEALFHLTWRKVYWPDGSCLWYLPAKQKALELMAQHRFDVVISVSLPFTAARIAQAVKQKHPGIRWLMDIEDPFSFVSEYFINNRVFYKKKNVRAEEKALRLADAVVVTVGAARLKYLAHFPFVEGKIAVIPPLYEELPTNSAALPASFQTEPGKIHLGYFGTFYYPIRSPEGLLRLLVLLEKHDPQTADRLVVHLVGAIPVEYAAVFSGFQFQSVKLRFYGLVARETVAAMMQQMDFLLNIGNTTDYHLPSKSAEYLLSGKPIVNIATIEEDTFADFMKDYPLFLRLLLPENQANRESVSAFSAFLERQKGKKVEKKIRQELGALYTVEVIAGQYLKCLE